MSCSYYLQYQNINYGVKISRIESIQLESRVCSRENREREFPGKWAKNRNRENREMETETEFGKMWGYSENKSILLNVFELILVSNKPNI